jgi:hypothetical protein
MFTTKIAGAAAALALLAAPATAAAHDGHHDGRHHHHHHRATVREVTGAATATVASFAGDDLTLSLPSGRTFTAAVTSRTEIECVTAAPAATTARHGDGNDDGPNHDAGDDDGNDGANHDAGDDNDNGAAACDSGALVAGARVAVAKLSVLGADATWTKVVIAK